MEKQIKTPKHIVISRKGFDSQNGCIPNPILPDGTLLVFPIPDKNDIENTFETLKHNGVSYYEIIKQLCPKSAIKPTDGCHLDPDLDIANIQRKEGWKPAFGQAMSPLGHLYNNNVDEGDLFLFFGWFKQTEYYNGKLRYVPNAPDLHVMFGYLQIDKVVKDEKFVPHFLKAAHPHDKKFRWERGQNAIFVATDNLTFAPEYNGGGMFRYDKKRVLTKPGMSRRVWDMPLFFKDIEISYHKNAWKGNDFYSVCKGQEFVFEPNEQAMEWVKNIITSK